MWLSIFVLQANYVKYNTRPTRQRRTATDSYAGPFHLPVTAATRESRRCWLGYERTELTDSELQEQGFVVGKPRQKWTDEQKRSLFTGLLAAPVEPVLPDQDAYRYLLNHHMIPAGHPKTIMQIKGAIKSINRKAPGWEQVPDDVQLSAARAEQLVEDDEEAKQKLDAEQEDDEREVKDGFVPPTADEDEDDEEGEGDENNDEEEEEDDPLKSLSEALEQPHSPLSPAAPVRPEDLHAKFGRDYEPKAAPLRGRGAFMDQVRLLERGGVCRSPKGRTESFLSLRDVEHTIAAPTAVTGGGKAVAARRLFSAPKSLLSPARVLVSLSPSRPSIVSSMRLPVAPAPAPLLVTLLTSRVLVFMCSSASPLLFSSSHPVHLLSSFSSACTYFYSSRFFLALPTLVTPDGERRLSPSGVTPPVRPLSFFWFSH